MGTRDNVFAMFFSCSFGLLEETFEETFLAFYVDFSQFNFADRRLAKFGSRAMRWREMTSSISLLSEDMENTPQ